MSFKLSKHARQELARRDIALADVEAVLAVPGQIVPEHGGIVCYQSPTTCDGKPCLQREDGARCSLEGLAQDARSHEVTPS